MSPRPYELRQRRAGMDATRTRILDAARTVLVSGDAFTLDAVARAAGVARVTIYDHFGDREALVESIFDDLAESGGLTLLPEAFGMSDPVSGLERFIEIFCGFYSTHRLLLRRLRALVVLGRGPLGGVGRDSRRREGLHVLLARIAEAGHPGADAPEVLHAIHVLTGFAFVDELAGVDGDPVDVTPQLVALVMRVATGG